MVKPVQVFVLQLTFFVALGQNVTWTRTREYKRKGSLPNTIETSKTKWNGKSHGDTVDGKYVEGEPLMVSHNHRQSVITVQSSISQTITGFFFRRDIA